MDYRLLTVINMMTSAAIVYMCICRLNVSTRDVHPIVRAYYSLILTGAMANGTQHWFFGQYPTLGGVIMVVCLGVGMAMGRHRWLNGAPDDVKKQMIFRCHT